MIDEHDDAPDEVPEFPDEKGKQPDGPSFCSKCGAKLAGGEFCSSCGAKVSSSGSANFESQKKPYIWSPTAAANWSLVFTPIFGAFLHYKNWRELGEMGKSSLAAIWVVISVVVIWNIVASPNIPPATGFLYLIIWYFLAGRSQINYVKKNFGSDYQKKGWSTPVIGAIVIGLVLLFLVVLLEDYDSEQAEQRSSGVSQSPPSSELSEGAGESPKRQGFQLRNLLSSTPSCSDQEVIELVTSISRDEFAREFGRRFRDREAGDYLADQVEYSLAGIRTTSRLENGGYQCATQLQLIGEQGTEPIEIVYTVELTDARDEIYVTVYGL